MKAYGGVNVETHIILIFALVGCNWSASRLCRFTPGERTPGTHWIGSWVGPRAGMDDVEKRKLSILQGLEVRLLGRPARSQSLHRLLPIWYWSQIFGIRGIQVREYEYEHRHTSQWTIQPVRALFQQFDTAANCATETDWMIHSIYQAASQGLSESDRKRSSSQSTNHSGQTYVSL
jgi:hypothetical protein